MSFSPSFKWRHFQPDIILCAVGWYLRYTLSYRDVEELLRERGVAVDHTTVFRQPCSETSDIGGSHWRLPQAQAKPSGLTQ